MPAIEAPGGRVKRILMLNYEFPPIGGGSGNATRYMLREFARAGDLDVEVVTSSDAEFRIEQFAARIRVHRLPVGKKDLQHWTPLELLRYSWRAYWYTRRLVDRQHFDLCHCWSGWPPGVIGYLLRAQTPYVVGLRGSDVPGYNPRLARFDHLIFAPLSRRVWSHARALVANSEDLGALAQRTYGATMLVIPNGVDTEEFAPGAEMGAVLRLLFVGRFVDRKNVPLVLRAMQNLSECILTLVGEGKRDAKWRELAQDLGIADRIRFVGHVAHDNLGPYYKDADVFVLPSDAEGMSNSLLEAMASGLAIVATDTGGASDLVGPAGVIVPAGDDAAFAKALQSLVSNREAVYRMKREARRRALTRTWREVADGYRSVYRKAVNALA